MRHHEFSVVYTDRALHHAAPEFMAALSDTVDILRSAYSAPHATVVPGTGTAGMESVARQFATGRRVLILQNGLFSYRWRQLLDASGAAAEYRVLCARQGDDRGWSPAPLDEVLAEIEAFAPDVVCAAQVETSAGILLPPEYIAAVGAATRAAGGLFVLDAIAAGCLWTDLGATDVDVLVSAPQKTWGGSPCGAFVVMSDRARARLAPSTTFSGDLSAWLRVSENAEQGVADYHATMPTDTIARNVAVMQEVRAEGFTRCTDLQGELGRKARAALEQRGFASDAADGAQAPSVVVSYAEAPDMVARLDAAGIRVSAGVPLHCGEGADFRTFRIGLFGLTKLRDIDGTVADLSAALDAAAAG